MVTQRTLIAEPPYTDVGFAVTERKVNRRFEAFCRFVERIRSESCPKVFPFREVERSSSKEDSCSALDSNYFKGVDNHGQRTMILHNVYGGFGETARVSENIVPTLRTPKGGGHLPLILQHSRDSTGKELSYNLREIAGTVKQTLGNQKNLVLALDLYNHSASSEVVPTLKDPCHNDRRIFMGTITEAVGTRQGSSKEFLSSVEKISALTGEVRRLTPVETERLQAFPDNWTKVEGVSETQRYKQMGNAVTVSVIEAIAKKLFVVLDKV